MPKNYFNTEITDYFEKSEKMYDLYLTKNDKSTYIGRRYLYVNKKTKLYYAKRNGLFAEIYKNVSSNGKKYLSVHT